MSKSDKESLLKSEFHRHATFKQWPFDDTKKCNTKKLAEAGFYKFGSHREDLVKCFLCSKELNGWDESDDPWEEHRSHASYCMFVKIGKPESCMTVAEYLGVIHQFQINRIQKEYDGHAELLEEAVKKNETENNILQILRLTLNTIMRKLILFVSICMERDKYHQQ